MRIVYGVFGYGRGHATRALSVLPELERKHDVLVLAAGDAYDALSEAHNVVELPSIGYVYGPSGRHAFTRTVGQNVGPVAEALLGFGVARALEKRVARFAPDAAISDAEPFTHRIAERLGIPRIGFDHFGLLAHCKVALPPWSKVRLARDALAYRALMGCPDRVIVSSFFPVEPKGPHVRVVGPLLRKEVLALSPRNGNSLLVYFNKGRHQLRPRLRAELVRLDCPVIVYGLGEGREGNLVFRRADNKRFLEDLAASRAVLSTAGNQLVGECIHFGKPLLVVPENTLEQKINALGVARLGIGASEVFERLDARRIERFLDASDGFRKALEVAKSREFESAEKALTEVLDEVVRSPVARSIQERVRYA